MKPNNQTPFQPPNTSNWKGRAPRSSQEAFGHQFVPDKEYHPSPSIKSWVFWLVAVAFGILLWVMK